MKEQELIARGIAMHCDGCIAYQVYGVPCAGRDFAEALHPAAASVGDLWVAIVLTDTCHRERTAKGGEPWTSRSSAVGPIQLWLGPQPRS